MRLEASQMPDSNELETLTALVENSRARIRKAVRIACRKYKHSALPDEIEDFTEQIIELLLEDDGRKLRSYDASKGTFATWLQSVVNHDVSRQLQKNHPAESLDDYLLTLSYAPQQEKELLRKEERAILYAEIDKLSLHDQTIARMKLRDVPNEEIAKELNIKPASVGREWRVIQTKLKQILTDGAQSKAKQSKAKQSKALTRFEKFASFFRFDIRFFPASDYKLLKLVAHG
jgi:RNA polymerase sigma factor (sigma-70 family)